MTPLVSVVTPVLNRVETIGRCVASVAAQTHPNVEHIVVDGGSTDGTVEALESLSRTTRVRWMSEPDGGMYDAINKGFARATGTVYAYLNSDDAYFPWAIEASLGRLRDGADLVFGDLGVLIDRSDRYAFYAQFYRDFDLGFYTHVATLGQPSVFWRRELADLIGPFDTSYRLLGDCEYWLRAAVAGATFARVDELVALQVDHSTTLRERYAGALREEFARLRATYGEHVAPPPAPLAARLMQKVGWRHRQLMLLIESRRRSARRWPRFTSFLHANGIALRPSYLLWHLAPARLRPASVSLVDPAAIAGALGWEAP